MPKNDEFLFTTLTISQSASSYLLMSYVIDYVQGLKCFLLSAQKNKSHVTAALVIWWSNLTPQSQMDNWRQDSYSWHLSLRFTNKRNAVSTRSTMCSYCCASPLPSSTTRRVSIKQWEFEAKKKRFSSKITKFTDNLFFSSLKKLAFIWTSNFHQTPS